MEISQRREWQACLKIVVDCCLVCLFSLASSQRGLACVWLAGLLGQWWAWQPLSVRGNQVTHTFSVLYPSTQFSQRNGRDRCCNQCEVCGNKRQQLTEKLCHSSEHTPKCGMTQIYSYSSHTRLWDNIDGFVTFNLWEQIEVNTNINNTLLAHCLKSVIWSSVF